jgi:phage terminase small subunit
MVPGPRPRPKAVKLLRGERRPSRVNYREPQAPFGVGPPPDHLSPPAQQVWSELRPALERAGVVTTLDVTAFELLVDAVAEYRWHRARPGHEAFAAGCWKRVARLLPEFGLTPSARSRLAVSPSAAPDSFEAFIARKPRR